MPFKIENKSSAGYIINEAGWKGARFTMMLIIHWLVVHSRTIRDAPRHTHKPELISYESYLSLCLTFFLCFVLCMWCLCLTVNPKCWRSSSNACFQRRLVQFQFFIFSCFHKEIKLYYNKKNKTCCFRVRLVSGYQKSVHVDIVVYYLFLPTGYIISEPPPSVNTKRKHAQKSSFYSIVHIKTKLPLLINRRT